VQEIIDFTANLTDRQKSIAEYWADGPNSELPPGHWHLFALQVAERDKHSLDEDVKMFLALSNAVFDAGIATWEAKRFYDTSRPATGRTRLRAHDSEMRQASRSTSTRFRP